MIRSILQRVSEAMFKIFVRRDEKRELIKEQVALFDELRQSLAG